MLFVKTDENSNVIKFPYSIAEFRRDNPGTSWPETIDPMVLADHNIYPVAETSQPEYDPNSEYLANLAPYKDTNGAWYRTWEVRRIPEEELANVNRSHRNSLLQSTDYTQLPDSPVDKNSWAVYRQALRDITKQADWPYIIEWPTPPSN